MKNSFSYPKLVFSIFLVLVLNSGLTQDLNPELELAYQALFPKAIGSAVIDGVSVYIESDSGQVSVNANYRREDGTFFYFGLKDNGSFGEAFLQSVQSFDAENQDETTELKVSTEGKIYKTLEFYEDSLWGSGESQPALFAYASLVTDRAMLTYSLEGLIEEGVTQAQLEQDMNDTLANLDAARLLEAVKSIPEPQLIYNPMIRLELDALLLPNSLFAFLPETLEGYSFVEQESIFRVEDDFSELKPFSLAGRVFESADGESFAIAIRDLGGKDATLLPIFSAAVESGQLVQLETKQPSFVTADDYVAKSPGRNSLFSLIDERFFLIARYDADLKKDPSDLLTVLELIDATSLSRSASDLSLDSLTSSYSLSENFEDCEASAAILSMGYDRDSPSMLYEILGKQDDGCAVRSEFLVNPNPDFIGKSMTCILDSSIYIEEAIQDLSRCEGELYNLMQNN